MTHIDGMTRLGDSPLAETLFLWQRFAQRIWSVEARDTKLLALAFAATAPEEFR